MSGGANARSRVLEALQCACSQDPSVLKVGEQQLKAWEKEPGFYTALSVSLPQYRLNLWCKSNRVFMAWLWAPGSERSDIFTVAEFRPDNMTASSLA